MKLSRTYDTGLDVLGGGLGIGDFIPWLNVVGKVAGGIAGVTGNAPKAGTAAPAQSTDDAIKKALAEQQLKQDAAKAEASAAMTRTILFATLGVVGFGTLTLLILKKK